MNLRTIYGDDVADKLLELSLTPLPLGTYRYQLDDQWGAHDCCIIGAAHILMNKTLGEPVNCLIETPSDWKAIEEARLLLGRDLSKMEEKEIESAINQYDGSEDDDAELSALAVRLFGVER